jgi:hypothetical protein
MRARVLWIVGGVLVAGAALWRALARRGRPVPVEPGPDPRAAELRRKLAESRVLVGERDEFEAAETSVDEAQSGPSDVDDRRRLVHDEGRAAARRMRRPPASDA